MITTPVQSHFLISLTTSLTNQAVVFLGRVWKILSEIPWQLYRLTQKVDSQAHPHFDSVNAEHLTKKNLGNSNGLPSATEIGLLPCKVVPHETFKNHVEVENTKSAQIEQPLLPDPIFFVETPKAPISNPLPSLDEPIYSPQTPLEIGKPIPPPPPSSPLKNPPLPPLAPSRNLNPSSQTKALDAQEKKPSRPKPTIIDVPSDGNCLLNAILKGVEIQYPALKTFQANGKTIDYTHRDLRIKGLDFIKEQIAQGGPLAEQCLGYLDSDRIEYNEDLIKRAGGFLKNDLERLAQALANELELGLRRKPAKKTRGSSVKNYARLLIKQLEIEAGMPLSHLSPSEQHSLSQCMPHWDIPLKGKYLALVKKAHEKNTKLIERVKEEIVSKTSEEFLLRCSQDRFWCSTLHLFALSMILKVPLAVHDPSIPIEFGAQTFNPAQSQLDPIQLYRVNGNHYQYILIPPTEIEGA